MTLLALCSLGGQHAQEAAAPVSVPIVRTELDEALLFPENGLEETAKRLEEERRRELELLDEVIVGGADQQTMQLALAQKAEIAGRMETEALAAAVLQAMGYGRSAVCCGAQLLTLFLPEEDALEAQVMTTILDAVSAQTGILGDSVKIILVKK